MIKEYISEHLDKTGLVVLDLAANDGHTNNAIAQRVKKYNWSGVFVEPVDWLFNRLEKSYENHSSCHRINVAVECQKSIDSGTVSWLSESYCMEKGIPPNHVSAVYSDLTKARLVPDIIGSHTTTEKLTETKDRKTALEFLNNVITKPISRVEHMSVKKLIEYTIETCGQIDLINMPQGVSLTEATPFDPSWVASTDNDDEYHDNYYGGHAFITFDEQGSDTYTDNEWIELLKLFEEFNIPMINTTTSECNPCLTDCPLDDTHYGMRSKTLTSDVYFKLGGGLGELDFSNSDPYNYFLTHDSDLSMLKPGDTRADRELWVNGNILPRI